MRSLLGVMGIAIVLGGCDGKAADAVAGIAGEETVSQMLRAGKLEACTRQEVKNRIIEEVRPKASSLYAADPLVVEARDNIVPTFTDVQAMGSEIEIGEISCAARMI